MTASATTWDEVVGVATVPQEYLRIPNAYQRDLHLDHVRLALQDLAIAKCPRKEATACLYCKAVVTGKLMAQIKARALEISPRALGLEVEAVVNEILAELLEERIFTFHAKYQRIKVLHYIFETDKYLSVLKAETERLRMIGQSWLDRLFSLSLPRVGNGEFDVQPAALDAVTTLELKNELILGVDELYPEPVVPEKKVLIHRVPAHVPVPVSPVKDRSAQDAYRAELDRQVTEKREREAAENAQQELEATEDRYRLEETERIRAQYDREMVENMRVLIRLKRMDRYRQRKALLLREQHALRRELRDVAAGRHQLAEDFENTGTGFHRRYGVVEMPGDMETAQAVLMRMYENVCDRETDRISVAAEVSSSDDEDASDSSPELSCGIEEERVVAEEIDSREQPRTPSGSPCEESDLKISHSDAEGEPEWIPLSVVVRRAVEVPGRWLAERLKRREHDAFVREGKLDQLMDTVRVLLGAQSESVTSVNEAVEKFNSTSELMSVKKLETWLDEAVSESTGRALTLTRVSEGRLGRSGVLDMFSFQWRDNALFDETGWLFPRFSAVWRLSCASLAAKSKACEEWLSEARGMTVWLKLKIFNSWSDFYFRMIDGEIKRLQQRLTDPLPVSEAVTECLTKVEDFIKPYRRIMEAIIRAVIERDEAAFYEGAKRLQSVLRHQRIREMEDPPLGLLMDLGDWL